MTARAWKPHRAFRVRARSDLLLGFRCRVYLAPVRVAQHVVAALAGLQLLGGVLLQLAEHVVQELPLDRRRPCQAQRLRMLSTAMLGLRQGRRLLLG